MSRYPSYHCVACGADMLHIYRPAGFDGFWGNRVYVKSGRCPNRTGIFGGLFSKHSYYEDRYPNRAEWFGFTDATIPRETPFAATPDQPGDTRP